MFKTEKRVINVVMVLLGLFMLWTFLSGCPVNINTSVPTVVETETSPIAEDMGTVIAHVNLSRQSKIYIDEAREWQVSRAKWLELTFQKGGGSQPYTVEIIDGTCDFASTIRSGVYDIYASITDEFGNQLFHREEYGVAIVAGQDNVISMEITGTAGYYFQFYMDDIPGDYYSWGYAVITVRDSDIQFWTYYYTAWDDLTEGYRRIFSSYLPITFDGLEMEGMMEIEDMGGVKSYANLVFSVFNAENGIMDLHYEEPDWLPAVAINVSIDHHYIYSGGSYWQSIQDVVDYSYSSRVELGSGLYDGFNSYGRELTVIGLGFDETAVVNVWGNDLPEELTFINARVQAQRYTPVVMLEPADESLNYNGVYDLASAVVVASDKSVGIYKMTFKVVATDVSVSDYEVYQGNTLVATAGTPAGINVSNHVSEGGWEYQLVEVYFNHVEGMISIIPAGLSKEYTLRASVLGYDQSVGGNVSTSLLGDDDDDNITVYDTAVGVDSMEENNFIWSDMLPLSYSVESEQWLNSFGIDTAWGLGGAPVNI